MKTLRRLTVAVLFFILVASIAGVQTFPQAPTPEEAGLSKERLQRIAARIQSRRHPALEPDPSSRYECSLWLERWVARRNDTGRSKSRRADHLSCCLGLRTNPVLESGLKLGKIF